MLPRFEITARHRPVAVVGTAHVGADALAGAEPLAGAGALALLAPYGAVEVAPASPGGRTSVSLTGPDGATLSVTLDDTAVSLAVGDTTRRSRRHGTTRGAVTSVALTLTGHHLAALTLEDGAWTVRGRIDLTAESGAPVTTDTDWLANLRVDWTSTSGARSWSAGTFGHLGLRDVRLVTYADGSPYRCDGGVLLTATSAGPGFFDTAHTSLWLLDHLGGVRHRADLFFERSDRPGGYGDHATHVVRDGDRWLVATSTWPDLPADRRKREGARVRVTLAETTADLTRGQHRLPTRPLDLPTDGPSVGVWDPHLVRDPDTGTWLVGYVSARRFFDFHPVLASGPSLDQLTLRAAATDRRATEGTTLLRHGGEWHVLASDGRDNRRGRRARFPVLDLDLHETGTVDAPYPTNIPWPTLVPPDPAVDGDRWRLVTFNGRPTGGRLAGYGTHGDLVVMHEAD